MKVLCQDGITREGRWQVSDDGELWSEADERTAFTGGWKFRRVVTDAMPRAAGWATPNTGSALKFEDDDYDE